MVSAHFLISSSESMPPTRSFGLKRIHLMGAEDTRFCRSVPSPARFDGFAPCGLQKKIRKSPSEDQSSETQLSRCTKLRDLENKEWFVALNWETRHTNCT